MLLKTDDPDFQEGVRLFNERRFFEAHEAWEPLWHRTSPGPEREVYQGLIQVAAACHHFLKGNPAGAQGCLRNAHAHVDPYLQEVSEFDLPAVFQAVEQAVAGKNPKLLPEMKGLQKSS